MTKKYYREHRLEIIKKCKIYRQNHKKEIIQKGKEYRKTHKEQIKISNKKWRINHKLEIKQLGIDYRRVHAKKIKENSKVYLQTHKRERNEYQRNRRKNDINFKIEGNLRKRIWNALNGISKSTSTRKLLGCNIDFFKNYYESKFTKGMTWTKVMNGEIHCDHIRPCASFDLSKPSEQKKCFNYKNLQPLWAEENLRKGVK